MAVGSAAFARETEGTAAAVALRHTFWPTPAKEGRLVILLLHPRTGKPKNRRFPLAILSVASVLEGREHYAIIDGNLDPHPDRTLDSLTAAHDVEMLAVSVMPGPQMVAAISLCREY